MPMQAFKGQYSWMLYGDDDTMFFVDNVLELLQDFDPSMPYIITGMLSLSVLRCLLCSPHAADDTLAQLLVLLSRVVPLTAAARLRHGQSNE